ncbi:unnamed protein product [Pieris brassicae]|uniref:Uncharacterized protein n=1 Tax=Pieris brassicae TaxID=7116 RepID=A0A9P0U020_PIEBR|nr:unnamed protein product [Pieris brassicae]
MRVEPSTEVDMLFVEPKRCYCYALPISTARVLIVGVISKMGDCSSESSISEVAKTRKRIFYKAPLYVDDLGQMNLSCPRVHLRDACAFAPMKFPNHECLVPCRDYGVHDQYRRVVSGADEC